jgi:hypothetical protein
VAELCYRQTQVCLSEFCASKNSVAAREIERKYALTAKSAWFMLMRIREVTKREPLAGLFAGTVVADAFSSRTTPGRAGP